MLFCNDFQTDGADDIIFSGDDISLESNTQQCVLKIAGRRVIGRDDDHTFRYKLCAGLEKYIFSSNINTSIYNIKQAIVECLTRDNLLAAGDFDIKVGKTNDKREAKLYIIFNKSVINSGTSFKIFVDGENQRIYLGA